MRASEEAREDGFTLIECLLAVAILGIAFTALLGGLRMTVLGSDIHRQQASAQAVLAQSAEAVKDESRNPFISCADLASGAKTYNPYTGVSNLPPGWAAATAIKIAGQVKVWTGSSWVAPASSICATADAYRMQLVTLQVASPDGRTTETASVVKKGT